MRKIRTICKITWPALVSLIAYALWAANCPGSSTFSVNGSLLGQKIQTKVNHQLAQTMLNEPSDPKVQQLFQGYGEASLTTKSLMEISQLYSNDVATLYFIQRLYKSDVNKKYQDKYLSYYHMQLENKSLNLNKLRHYYIAFVPGLAYKEDTTTGADFKSQRRLLSYYGIQNELIATEEWGLSQANAKIIAQRLKELSAYHDSIMVVSASKGGLEAALALGQILSPKDCKSIRSWVSVGGILRGSPVADTYLKAPKCWLAQIALWSKGRNINLVRDISYEKRKSTFGNLNFPEHLKLIHFVGAPLAKHVNDAIKNRYCSMLHLGPNDGLTPLADEITREGIVISELGLDHYFRHKNIDEKTLALALAATE